MGPSQAPPPSGRAGSPERTRTLARPRTLISSPGPGLSVPAKSDPKISGPSRRTRAPGPGRSLTARLAAAEQADPGSSGERVSDLREAQGPSRTHTHSAPSPLLPRQHLPTPRPRPSCPCEPGGVCEHAEKWIGLWGPGSGAVLRVRCATGYRRLWFPASRCARR